jgi:hypothetical protein
MDGAPSDATPDMANYLREQSAGEILRGTVDIYRRNFLQLCGMYLLPTFPFLLLKLKMLEHSSAYSYHLWLAIWVLVTPFAAAVLTVGVSDICVGNRSSIMRSLRRVFSTIFGKVILTNSFMFIIVTALFVPGLLTISFPIFSVPLLVAASVLTLLFLVWWMFVPTVIVLEGTFGWTALKRSKALARGHYIRNCAMLLLLYIPTFILGRVLFFSLQVSGNDVLKVIGVALQTALYPLPLIATVLLYYDLRARSEGYDLTMLSQDLRR